LTLKKIPLISKDNLHLTIITKPYYLIIKLHVYLTRVGQWLGMNSQRKAVLMDFDGTIVDSIKATYNIFKGYVEMHGKPFISFEEFKRNFKADWISFLKNLGVDIRKEALDVKILVEQYRNAINKIEIDPSIKDAIKSFKDLGFIVAVVSSSLEKAIMEKLETEDIHVDLIVSGFELKITDKAKLIEIALTKLQIDPRNVVYIGDMIEDVKAGRIVGVKVIAFAKGLHSKTALEASGADIVISDGNRLIEATRSIGL
jgi:phosphoglycolate phosphatase-like HAD superfamily hydrolase